MSVPPAVAGWVNDPFPAWFGVVDPPAIPSGTDRIRVELTFLCSPEKVLTSKANCTRSLLNFVRFNNKLAELPLGNRGPSQNSK